MTDEQIDEVCAAIQEILSEILDNPEHLIHEGEISERARYHTAIAGAD